MKLEFLNLLRSPIDRGELEVIEKEMKNGEIYQGKLKCKVSGKEFPIINYIPRLIEKDNYSESWGELWVNTVKQVRDSYTGDSFYYDCIFGKHSEENEIKPGYSMFGFDWPEDLSGQRVLEIGPGTGCCTEHLIKSGCELICLDMSHGIDTFEEEWLTNPNVHVVQADMTHGVLEHDLFDRIWLFQVLQHTPDPEQTLKDIKPYLKEGGEISFTSYSGKFYPWWLFFTKNRSYEWVHRWTKFWMPFKYYPQKVLSVFGLPILPKIYNRFTRWIDPRNIYFRVLQGDYKESPQGRIYAKNKDKQQLFELAVVNTHDAITPEYTNGAHIPVVVKWTENAKYKNIRAWGKGGVRVKANK